MNSLQYLSTQVDRVIGKESETPILAKIDEEDESHSSVALDLQTYDEDGKNTTVTGQSADILPWYSIWRLYSLLKHILYYIFHLGHASEALQPAYIDSSDLHLQSPSQPRYRKHMKSISSSSTASGSILRTLHGVKLLPPPRPILSKKLCNKTLVLDLDETLIHSLSRSSKYSDGHMVEVKLDNQLATLYYVTKRPFCDDFLRNVSRWYHLVVFTASVQAYADPLIDWLEREGKYFSKRLYRQDCTPTETGGYIKDLSKVNSDLSKVIIVDNSPISYSMHRDNAIAIEGWISDPSDHSLLYLVPLLNALRYTTDVRSFLGLKMGESAFE